MDENRAPTQKKEEIVTEIKRAQDAARAVRSMAHQLVEGAQLIDDIAGPARQYAEGIPDDTYLSADSWNRMTRVWRAEGNALEEAQKQLAPVASLSLSLQNLTTSTASAGFMISTSLVRSLPEAAARQVQTARESFVRVWHQGNALADARKEMKRLGLDAAPPTGRGPVVLLEEAWNTYLKPGSANTSPAAVLLPLRGSIHDTLAELLRRRPTQQKVKGGKEKVLSIASQLARPEADPRVVDQLADEAPRLLDALSDSKQAQLGRDDVNLLLLRGTKFLAAFLMILDELKLRT